MVCTLTRRSRNPSGAILGSLPVIHMFAPVTRVRLCQRVADALNDGVADYPQVGLHVAWPLQVFSGAAATLRARSRSLR